MPDGSINATLLPSATAAVNNTHGDRSRLHKHRISFLLINNTNDVHPIVLERGALPPGPTRELRRGRQPERGRVQYLTCR